MAVEKLEIETYFGKCKCCLNYGYLRTMWEKHVVEEETEIYGQMLTQCFNIEWTRQGSEENDQICEDCIWKLREAYLFKKQVQRCQKEIQQCESEDYEIKSDPDNENYDVEYLEEDILDNPNSNDGSDEDSCKESLNLGESHDENHSQDDDDGTILKEDDDDEDYDENQDPEDADDTDFDPDSRRKRKPQEKHKDDADSESDAPKPKWPKRLPKDERSKTYKQYSMDALKGAVEAVTARRMNQKQAAKHYQVPRKTLSAKVREVKNNDHVFPTTDDEHFVQELKLVLKYINATPFRSRANRPCCFYCDERAFSSPDELRRHSALHDRSRKLEAAMRPLWSNEIVKIDIKDVTCRACRLDLQNWPSVLEHLQKVHALELEFKKNIIPFVLGGKSCALCAQEFSAFMLLDSHMNSHYSNYVCGNCGDPFATRIRLKAHEKTHSTGRFPCPSCNKVFTLLSYMKKHYAFTHAKVAKVKCHHCDALFRSDYQRQAHIVMSHKEHVETMTCELCGATFEWMRHFMRHMRRRHGSEYNCLQCGKFFDTVKLLKEHRLTHTGVKEFKCLVCHKSYYSRTSLHSHMKYKHQNIKICAMFFNKEEVCEVSDSVQ